MTVSIRPGRYTAAVLQRPNGDTRQGPWQPAGMHPLIWWLAYKDERVVYAIHCTLPPPKHQGEGT